jgi:hypothetical protein
MHRHHPSVSACGLPVSLPSSIAKWEENHYEQENLICKEQNGLFVHMSIA